MAETLTPNASQLPETPWPASVAVIGAAGLIGSGVVANLALSRLCREIRMIDVRQNLVEAHRIDIAESQAMAGLSNPTALLSGPGEGPVDLVIVGAGGKTLLRPAVPRPPFRRLPRGA